MIPTVAITKANVNDIDINRFDELTKQVEILQNKLQDKDKEWKEKERRFEEERSKWTEEKRKQDENKRKEKVE